MYRAACHVHSDWSYDGRWTLRALAGSFRKRGYNLVLTTEHDKGFTEERRLRHRTACAEASDEHVCLIPGIEYSDAQNQVHVLVWGDVPFLGEGLPTSKLLEEVEKAKGVAVLAHPTRKAAWKLFDPKWAESLVGIELWNRKTDGWAPSRAARKLIEMTQLPSYFGLDFHDTNQFFPCAMRLCLNGPATELSVIAALKDRRVAGEVFGGSWLTAPGPLADYALRSAETFRRTLARLIRKFRRRSAIRKGE